MAAAAEQLGIADGSYSIDVAGAERPLGTCAGLAGQRRGAEDKERESAFTVAVLSDITVTELPPLA